ncbi:chaplin [Streptomyces sp. NPDC091219]|uniref:chaplin n=1 Tax=Streptomyces sp. NPDC091219 TaxID=3155193 RepID=UPI00344F34FD
MKRVARNGVIAVAAASGALAAAMPAFADSGADGTAAGSPGVISGNTIQLPVHVPVNVCGDTVNVVGLLNPAMGNSCANDSGAKAPGIHRSGGKNTGRAHGGAVAQGGEKDSPGLLSGNGLQLPIHLPVNVSGNSVSVVGVGNPSVGNHSENTSGGDHPHHPAPPAPAPTVPVKPHPGPAPMTEVKGHPAQPVAEASLAHTGADGTIPAAALSAGLLLGGAALYRRYRPTAGR